MANPLDSTNRALQDVNLDVSGGVQQKTVERVGEAQKDSSTGRTTMSYNVKMTMDNGTQRSFKITVGFSREQLAAHLSGQGEGSGKLEDTIYKIVNGMKAEDIMKAAGNRISARLDYLDNATVTKLHGGEQKSLRELLGSQDESEKTMASSISKVINAFSKSEVGNLFSSNLNKQTFSSGPPSGPLRENIGGGSTQERAAPLSEGEGTSVSADDLQDQASPLIEEGSGEDSSVSSQRGEAVYTPSKQAIQAPPQGTRQRSAIADSITTNEESRPETRSRASTESSSGSEGGETVSQGQAQARKSKWQKTSPNSGRDSERPPSSLGSQRHPHPTDNPPPLPDSVVRGRSSSADSTQTTPLPILPKSLEQIRLQKHIQPFKDLGPPPELKLPPTIGSSQSEGASGKKEASGQVQQNTGEVVGQDVSQIGADSSVSIDPTIHSITLNFEVEEETPTTTRSLEETKPTEKKEQQSTENELSSKKEKLTNLHTRLIKGQSKKWIKKKTGITQKQYQEAVSDIIDLGDAHIIELKYEVPIPLKKGQKLNKGEKPKTQTATVETTQLLRTFLGKKAGQKAILEDSSTYDRLTKNSLEHIRKYSPELAKTIETMDPPSDEEKLERLNFLLDAREISTRYEVVCDKLDVTEENLAPVDTSKVTFDFDQDSKDTQIFKLMNIVKETFTTETSYAEGFNGLTAKAWGEGSNKVTFYEHLEAKGIISKSDLHILQAKVSEAEEQAARTLCDLAGKQYNETQPPAQNISEAKQSYEKLTDLQKFQNNLNAFRSGRSNSTIRPMAGNAIKMKQTIKILDKIKANSDATTTTLLNEFRTKNNNLDPSAIAITPIQRAPRYRLLQQDLLKKAPPSAKSQITKNLENIKSSAEIVNSLVAKS